MRKIGLTLLTLTIALAACGEVPTAASADDAQAASNIGVAESGYYEEEDPGSGGSGNETAPEDDAWMAVAENPGLLGSGH